MSLVRTRTIDDIPTELLCYIFTFLTSREEIKAAISVSRRWCEAFTYDEIWRRSYFRFYGHVQKGPAENITSWSQVFRRRAAQDFYIRKLTRTVKLMTTEDRMQSARLLGGSSRAVLVLLGNPARPHIVNLSTEVVVPFNLGLDITTTIILPSDNGHRLLVGNGTGVVTVYQYFENPPKESTKNAPKVPKQKLESEKSELTFQYKRVNTFSDGHNHVYNMNRSIEQISENQRFLVSLAYNNTVAIWEITPLEYGDAHSYDIITRRNMRTVIDEYEFYQFQLQQAANRPPGVPLPAPRRQLPDTDTILQYRGGVIKDSNSSSLIKSLLFKYPPSLVYMMPGNLLHVVIGLRNGKVLVWQTLNNYILQGHSVFISHAIGFTDKNDTYLVTFSKDSGELCLWNLNTTLSAEETVTNAHRLLIKVVLTREFSASVRSLVWNDFLRQLLICGDKIQFWGLWNKKQAGQSGKQQEPLHWITMLGEKEKRMTCMHFDEARNLIISGFDDGSISVYFVSTCQCLLHLPPTRSNQYFSLFHVEADNHTIISVDDYCIHWRNLGKIFL